MAQQDTSDPSQAIPGGNTVLVEFEERVAWVKMNRPAKRNAINPTLSAEMLAVLDALEADPRCGVLILTGIGEAYSAGMDLQEFFRATDGLPAEERVRYTRASAQWQWRRLSYFMKPTIAMVNGWCFGGAFNNLIACDLAIAAEDAKFGLSEINWGIIPAGNVLKSVMSVMGQRDALYYTMTGETFDGVKAAAMGLVNEAVPASRLRQRTLELAKVLLSKNPTALRTAKHACRRVRDLSWDDAEDYLSAKLDQSRFLDPERGREQGLKQFLDDKTYRPGLRGYERKS
ncbi:MAG TPA: p-hydroxycinnamoyl CoA hydratase/lyase [Candidatus Binataceae bacterium]|nr:p-hydroxycinnamoyl CoA hydratase/lyase [Candidatus Binataceae bacterium]